jgi:hypothetical protein
VRLAIDDHRVDDHADVIRDRDVDDLDDPGLRIDLDLGDMRARREREVLRSERVLPSPGSTVSIG